MNQDETVLNFFQTVFYGHSGHCLTLWRPGLTGPRLSGPASGSWADGGWGWGVGPSGRLKAAALRAVKSCIACRLGAKAGEPKPSGPSWRRGERQYVLFYQSIGKNASDGRPAGSLVQGVLEGLGHSEPDGFRGRDLDRLFGFGVEALAGGPLDQGEGA